VPRRLFGALVVVLAFLALGGSAQARLAYVTNSADGTVSAFDVASGAVVANVAVGKEPVDVAISPDGTRAYVANKGSNTVSVIDTASNSVVANLAVGKEPDGIAVSPNGAAAYVSNFGDESVSLISTATDTAPIGPIHVGEEPEGVAIAPDGGSVFVARGSGGVAVVSTATNQMVGTVPDPFGPSRIAIVPSGGRGFVTDVETGSVTAFDPHSAATVGAPIPVGAKPAGIAIEPGGRTAYVASPVADSVTPIDTSLDSLSGPPSVGFPAATGIAIAPDGLHGYVTDGSGSAVTVLDAAGEVASGSIGVGSKPVGVAVMPDQGPRASLFISPARPRAKKVVTVHASGSTDADGKIADYLWEFGDGSHAEGPEPTRTHRYRKRGEYTVTLKVVDEEGCSTEVVYTGQTASCNGSAAAVASRTIFVADTRGPVLKLGGAKRQAIGPKVYVRARCPRESCGLQAHGAVIVAGGGTARAHSALLPSKAPKRSTGWRVLRLGLPGPARRAASRALAEGGEAKVVISVLARDRDNELTLSQRKLTLRP
jgi:YVTN family beta-propeller protein